MAGGIHSILLGATQWAHVCAIVLVTCIRCTAALRVSNLTPVTANGVRPTHSVDKEASITVHSRRFNSKVSLLDTPCSAT